MTTPLAELLAAVPALNDPAKPFAFEARGSQIVGTWDIVTAQTLYPAEFDTIDKKYSITVSFDEEKGTYTFTEKKTSTSATVSGNGISFGASTFSGKTTGKEFNFELGGVRKDSYGNPTAAPLVWSFDTGRIKVPLFDFLRNNGWTRKKGLLSGLFNR